MSYFSNALGQQALEIASAKLHATKLENTNMSRAAAVLGESHPAVGLETRLRSLREQVDEAEAAAEAALDYGETLEHMVLN